jgi:vacuolar-type H+-ATPase subunit I/STV1
MFIFGFSKTRAIFWGVVFVTLGMLLLLSNYQVLEFSKEWPILLIIWGLFKIINGIVKGNRISWGLTISLIGIVLLMSNHQISWFIFKFSRDWPIILIALGVLKVIDALSAREWFRFSKTGTRRKDYHDIIEDIKDGEITVEEAIDKIKE